MLAGALLVAALAGGCVDARYGHRHGGYRLPDDDQAYDDDRYDHGRPRRRDVPTVVCASKDGRPNRCPLDVRIQHAEVDKRYSRSRCDYGRSWGWDRDAIWVDHGCRARFRLTPAGRWR